MSEGWTPAVLLQRVGARGAHPAAIAFGESGAVAVESGALAAAATRLAQALIAAGCGDGTRVALCGPAGIDWITVALGVLAAGGVLVPVDDLADAAQFEAALATSRATVLVAGAARLEAAAPAIAARGLRTLRLEADAAEGWRALPPGEAPLPVPAPDTTLVLSWTSGTTGSAKIFPLSLRNIASIVEMVERQRQVSEADRALLPLPLHHAYPLVVGVLTLLTVGATVVLPAGTTGPLIVRALREADVTAIIGVPRLYDAILAALETRLAARGWLVRRAWHGALAAAARLRRSGLELGRVLFLPVRRSLAPRLRLMVSGGARLDAGTEEALGALGWTVLCGYGLAETASMFTGSLPHDRRIGSAGKLLGGAGEMRIADPDAQGVGEVQLRGPAVMSGYLDNPEANAAAFTADGWFRTGDLGRIDADGFLFITGRARELIVLGGGKKIDPEALERVYAAAPGIAELALLEVGGALVALVRADAAALRARGITNPRDGVHVALTGCGQELPSYQRLSGFALTETPLPRTRLGKLRRFQLPALYAAALAGVTRRQPGPLSEADAELLRDPLAGGVWALLRQRFPEQAIDLDASLALDLNLDSFGWMELAVVLQDRFGLALTQAEIAGLVTIRDLLRLVAGGAGRAGAAPAAPDPQRWLAPTGPLLTAAGAVVFALNWLVLRVAFRLRVRGAAQLPEGAGFVITPNHASDLDALVIAAALPFARLRRLYWAGDMVRLFSSAPARLFCRIVHLFPVDETQPAAAVTTAARVLGDGGTQVWFPEGWRSPDGQCRRFLPGIGQLLLRTGAPAVPVWIDGAFAAMPRSRRIPRLHRISVVFGAPVPVAVLRAEGEGRNDEERIADGLRRRVVALGQSLTCQSLP